MDDLTVAPGIPADFDRFTAFPLHRLFAVSDDPPEGDAAVWLIRTGHDLGGETVRFVQRLTSADIVYLHDPDVALRDGRMVIAVSVGPDDLNHLAALVRGQGGRSLARLVHRDYVPVAS